MSTYNAILIRKRINLIIRYCVVIIIININT
jgi:hypothetical protein